MKILSWNVNDFGGSEEHLMCYKKIDFSGRERLDWGYWKSIDKTDISEKIFHFVLQNAPEIVIFQEFEVNNSDEPMQFIEAMEEHGYVKLGNMLDSKASMTIGFIKKDIPFTSVKVGAYRNGRHFAVRASDILIYGVHVPVNYDEAYWADLLAFYKSNCDQKLLIIGDFNTFADGTRSKAKFNELIGAGAVDVWRSRGGQNEASTEKKYGGRLDYALASSALNREIQAMKIDQSVMESKISDHAVLLLDV